MQTLRLLALPIVACLVFSTGCATTGKSHSKCSPCMMGTECKMDCKKECCAKKCGPDCKKPCCAKKAG